MKVIAHIERHDDGTWSLGFGDFVIHVDDSEHYCYHYLGVSDVEQLFSAIEVDKIKNMKNEEQLIVSLELSILSDEKVVELTRNGEILNASEEEEIDEEDFSEEDEEIDDDDY